jgi:hypothetical protein
MFPTISSSKQGEKITPIAFYNVENFFNTVNKPITADDDFTPKGKNK